MLLNHLPVPRADFGVLKRRLRVFLACAPANAVTGLFPGDNRALESYTLHPKQVSFRVIQGFCAGDIGLFAHRHAPANPSAPPCSEPVQSART